MKIINKLCLNYQNFIRLGKSNDGGYNIPKKALKEAEILFSFGLDDDWSFEQDFKNKTNAKIICFDNSVNKKFWLKRFLKDIFYFSFKKNIVEQLKRFFTFFKYQNFVKQENVFHIKKHINSSNIKLSFEEQENFTNFENILKEWKNKSFFLKMDIEGNEYGVLDDIIQNKKNMLGMVIEFHSCDLMSDKIKKFIEEINLELVHIHVNNYCSITKNDFPTVLELTFSSKNYNSKRNSNEFNFPDQYMDQPNDKYKEDKKLIFY